MYTCFPGKGPKPVQKNDTLKNSTTLYSCATACELDLNCLSFDFASEAPYPCRFFNVSETDRLGNVGMNDRIFCVRDEIRKICIFFFFDVKHCHFYCLAYAIL